MSSKCGNGLEHHFPQPYSHVGAGATAVHCDVEEMVFVDVVSVDTGADVVEILELVDEVEPTEEVDPTVEVETAEDVVEEAALVDETGRVEEGELVE